MVYHPFLRGYAMKGDNIFVEEQYIRIAQKIREENDMKGDVIVVEEYHKKAARVIVPQIIEHIKKKATRYTITVAGESGSGKSETGKAIADELEIYGITSVLLGQDDYFVLPPMLNDPKRREDPEWLGPHVEVKLDVLEQNLKDAIEGKNAISKPLIDYDSAVIEKETISLDGVKVVIAEGTYTSLLKHVDTKIFIARNRLDTLEHRKKRNRGVEVNDPFIEQILVTEHKIIAGHKQLADFVITKDYDVIIVEE
jgi:uridine kinase